MDKKKLSPYHPACASTAGTGDGAFFSLSWTPDNPGRPKGLKSWLRDASRLKIGAQHDISLLSIVHLKIYQFCGRSALCTTLVESGEIVPLHANTTYAYRIPTIWHIIVYILYERSQMFWRISWMTRRTFKKPYSA
jgi:hypothetical protein